MYTVIACLERAKDKYMLDGHISIPLVIKYSSYSLFDDIDYIEGIRYIRKAAGTDHLAQWEADHTREDGVKLFDKAIKLIRSEPVASRTTLDYISMLMIPASLLIFLLVSCNLN